MSNRLEILSALAPIPSQAGGSRAAMGKPTAPLEDLARVAAQNARNLWQADDLSRVAPEQWQRVLNNVEARMRMRDVELPTNWRVALARYVGRIDG